MNKDVYNTHHSAVHVNQGNRCILNLSSYNRLRANVRCNAGITWDRSQRISL